MAGLLTAPAGAVLAGFAADAYGLPPVMYGATAVLAVVTVLSWRPLWRNRTDGSRLYPA